MWASQLLRWIWLLRRIVPWHLGFHVAASWCDRLRKHIKLSIRYTTICVTQEHEMVANIYRVIWGRPTIQWSDQWHNYTGKQPTLHAMVCFSVKRLASVRGIYASLATRYVSNYPASLFCQQTTNNAEWSLRYTYTLAFVFCVGCFWKLLRHRDKYILLDTGRHNHMINTIYASHNMWSWPKPCEMCLSWISIVFTSQHLSFMTFSRIFPPLHVFG